MFFRGYVVTENKNCVETFKGKTNLKTLEQVRSLPEYAGVLDEDTILIDVDNFEQSEMLLALVQSQELNCRVYKTTRGKHFLFRDCGLAGNRTHCTLAVGIVADIKCGKKNSYEVLKFNDQEREILLDVQGEQADVLPRWMTPIKGGVDFVGMESGSGRNQALFNYILTLQAADFSVEGARECIRLINKFVLKDPLSDDEIETILRDEAFTKELFFNKNGFLFDKFATFLKNNLHICRINNQLHFFRDGVYLNGRRDIEAEMLKQIPDLSRARRTEVYEYLESTIRKETQSIEADLIAFRNGVYNVATDEFVSFTSEHIIINKLDWDYNPNAACPLVDEVLDKIACNDSEIRTLLEEIIGYCFYRRNELGKAFILTGEKSNGKSTFLDMVKTALGEGNICALDLKEVNERFKMAELFGKLANIGDDIGDEFIPNTGVFKKLVIGDELTGERKGQDPFKFHSYAKLLFSANNIPRLGKGKDSAAIARRLIIVPFLASFSVDDPDYKPYIKYELRTQAAMEYLIMLGLRGLKRVLVNRRFTEGAKVQSQLTEYEKSNNPILGFFDETDIEQIVNEPTSKVYIAYTAYCLRDGLQPLSNIEFSRQVVRHFGLTTKFVRLHGAGVRIFVADVADVADV